MFYGEKNTLRSENFQLKRLRDWLINELDSWR